MALEVVGREQELASLQAFLAEPWAGPAALVLVGEAGIGKTTLWQACLEQARATGLRVLEARPAEAERGLAHAGLGDLFEGLLDGLLPALTAPRRGALERALLLGDGDDDPARSAGSESAVDPRALGLAVRDVLEALASDARPVLAIDDVQWLDDASAQALSFALRRLAASPALLLLARRESTGAGRQPSPLERALPAERTQQLTLGPLSVGALHRVLRDQLGRPLARQTLLRIHERSGGNPFYALELGRALGPQVEPLQPLPVPRTLDGLLRARLAGLPAPTRDALALASALGSAAQSLLERAGVTPEALTPALAAHVLELERGVLRFSHPLLASVVYADLGAQRAAVHARVARLVDDPLARARHLALSRDAPDAAVAAILDDAARGAAERGALALAAELAEQALRLTPDAAHDERHRRALGAARAQRAAGEWTRAHAIASELLADDRAGALRAECLVLLAELTDVERSIALLEAALREASSRPALRCEIHAHLAWASRFRVGFVAAGAHAHAALELAEQLDDDRLRIGALCALATLDTSAGGGLSLGYATRACALSEALGDELLQRTATMAMCTALGSAVDLARPRALLEAEARRWQERDEAWTARTLWSLALIEVSARRWEVAAEHADRAHDIAVQYGLEVPPDLLPIALVALHRGELERAQALSQRALALAVEQFGLHPPIHLAIVGLATLWGGDAEKGVGWLDRATEQASALAWGEPSVRLWSDDHVEALLEVGRHADARRVLDRWEADALRLGRDRVLAHVTRCHGVEAAARGDVEQAGALLELAVARHEQVGDPFGRARALLALGGVRRRALHRRAAREALASALAGFEQLGAATWVARTKVELGTIGGRQREAGLTPAEQRVADLVARGQTNREVAAALFLGERTVASHLTSVYAKLGIRSRTELARRLP